MVESRSVVGGPAHKRNAHNHENKIGDKDILNKKTKTNPKFAHVKAVTTTGQSSKGMTTVSDQLIAKRKTEKFKRVKCSTLARLLREQTQGSEESIYDLNRMGNGPDNMDSVSVVAGQNPQFLEEKKNNIAYD